VAVIGQTAALRQVLIALQATVLASRYQALTKYQAEAAKYVFHPKLSGSPHDVTVLAARRLIELAKVTSLEASICYFAKEIEDAIKTGNDHLHDRCINETLQRFTLFDVSVAEGVLPVLWDEGQRICKIEPKVKDADVKADAKDKGGKDSVKKEKSKKDKKKKGKDSDEDDEPGKGSKKRKAKK
jgi:hypothetical protein